MRTKPVRRLAGTLRAGALAGGALTLLALAVACSETEAPAVSGATTPVATRAAAEGSPDTLATAVAPAAPRTHVLTAGQTLDQVASEYGVPLADLVEWNEIPDASLVSTGQIILIEAPPLSTQAPLRRAPVETEKRDPLLDWVRERWESLPGFGITNNGVRSGITVAFVFLVGSMTAMALAVAFAVLRSLVRLKFGGPARAEPEASREPVLVYVGGPSSRPAERAPRSVVPQRPERPTRSLIEPAVAPGAPPSASIDATSSPMAASRPSGAPRPSVAPPPVDAEPATGERGGSRRGGGPFDILNRRLGLLGSRQRKEEERRRELSLQRWWKHGTETLRIGLLDDAERHFREGLREAERFEWDDERQLYEEALAHVAERRQALEARSGAETRADHSVATDAEIDSPN